MCYSYLMVPKDVHTASPDHCPIRGVISVIGEKWTAEVMYFLAAGTQRHGELSRLIPGVSKKILTQTLRRLERDGLVKRTVYPVVPPKVEYTLTPLGQTFLTPIISLCDWAQQHESELEAVSARREQAKEPIV